MVSININHVSNFNIIIGANRFPKLDFGHLYRVHRHRFFALVTVASYYVA